VAWLAWPFSACGTAKHVLEELKENNKELKTQL